MGSLVAVVDDDEQYAARTADILDEAGFVPTIISRAQGPFRSPDQLLQQIAATGCSAAICDHRLRPQGFATFTGAEAVARLYRQHLPAALLSTFSAIDGDSSIRLYRSEIPAVIDRERLDPDEIVAALEQCDAEIHGTVRPERRTRRTLVRAVGVFAEGGIPVVDAVIHVWNPDRAIRFPRSLVESDEIRAMLPDGFEGELRLFAQINVGCRSDNELFLRSFELAPEATIDDI